MNAYAAIDRVRGVFACYAFPSINEADLQAQVVSALTAAGLSCDREVLAERGRYDVVVTLEGNTVVLELKVKAAAGDVERQAQRYALTDGVDAVVLVTTSNRLAAQLRAGMLGGKPFGVITLRTF